MTDIVSWLALGLSIVSAGASAISYFFGIRRQRQAATLDAYNRLQNEVLDYIYRNYTRSQIEEIVAKRQTKEYRDAYKELGTYIARIEHFCVGVNNRIYDRKTVYQLAKGFLDKTIYNLIAPVIDVKDSIGHGEYYSNTRRVITWLNKDE